MVANKLIHIVRIRGAISKMLVEMVIHFESNVNCNFNN